MTHPTTARIGARELVALLGSWHAEGSRRTATELAAALRVLIIEGSLAIGTLLPAEREFARALPASRTLVSAALDRLRADGFVHSRQGSGSWASLPGDTPRLGLGEPGPGVIDFARAAPEPVPWLMRAFEAARLRFPRFLETSGYTAFGVPETRARIAEWFTARGLPTEPGQVLVATGALTALSRIFEVYTAPGARCLIEQPSYANALLAVERARLRPLAVPMTASGWDLPAVETALRTANPAIGYVVPDFQNPTGHRMSEPDRERFGRILRRAKIPFVVDETVVELDYTGAEAPRPLAALAPGQVITIGSASKSHWGGLRIGWVRAEREVIERLARTDLGAPIFEQLLLAELLDGDLGERRELLRERRDELVRLLRANCPQWSFRVPGGGLSLWCELPEPVSTRLVVEAERDGVWLVPGGRFGAHGGLERWIRVPFAQRAEQLRECVRVIAAASARLHGADGVVEAPDLPVV